MIFNSAFEYLPNNISKMVIRFQNMTPTIQCFDDQSTQIPASILCNNLFFQENHQTSASDRMSSNSGEFNFCIGLLRIQL